MNHSPSAATAGVDRAHATDERATPMTATTTESTFPLHLAAMRGDFLEIKRLTDSGADVNALDDQGRTLVACAVIGEDWDNPKPYIPDYNPDLVSNTPLDRYDALSTIIEHPNTSLFTLNAPQRAMKGVTPLVFAAYMNEINFVKILLETSGSQVAVNGMDTHGATPLMYAARDGNIEVVNTLIAWGARPDIADSNHRSSLYYGLRHPRILCLLEDALREQRWYENQSPTQNKIKNPNFLLPLVAASLDPCNTGLPNPEFFTENALSGATISLIQAINSSQIDYVYQTLFPLNGRTTRIDDDFQSVLVNLPDSHGWSPIHYCASHESPSTEVLDALYSAGADMCLFTSREQYTPLHCLAKFANSSSFDKDSSVYQFAIHLIRDLQASLSARDRRNETCMHIAAERGESLDVLLAILECDATGAVRQMRNDRGLTPLDIAKPQFRIAFTIGQARIPSSVSPSGLSLPPKTSPMLLSLLLRRPSLASVKAANHPPFPADFNLYAKSKELLAHFRFTSPSIEHGTSSDNLSQFEWTLRQGDRLGQEVIQYMQGCLDDFIFESKVACIMRCNLTTLSETMQAARQKTSRRLPRPKPDRSSGGSESTAVDGDAFLFDVDKLLSLLDDGEKQRKEAVITHQDVCVSTDSSDAMFSTLVDASDPCSLFESKSLSVGQDGVRKAGRFSKLMIKRSFIRRLTVGPENDRLGIENLIDDSIESALPSAYPESTHDQEGSQEGPQKEGLLRTFMKRVKDVQAEGSDDKPTTDDHPDTPIETESLSGSQETDERNENIRKPRKLKHLMTMGSLKKKTRDRVSSTMEMQDEDAVDARPDATPDPEPSTECQATIISNEFEERERKEGKLKRFIKQVKSSMDDDDETVVGDRSDTCAKPESPSISQEPTDDYSIERKESVKKEGKLKRLKKRAKDSPSTATKDDAILDISSDIPAGPELRLGESDVDRENLKKEGMLRSLVKRVRTSTTMEMDDDAVVDNHPENEDGPEVKIENSIQSNEEKQENARKEGRLKSLMKRVKQSTLTEVESDSTADDRPDDASKKVSGISGPTKLKAWLKRKTLHSRKLEVLLDVEDDLECSVGREVKQSVPPADIDDLELTQQNANSTFLAVRRDLTAIGRNLGRVDESVAACRQVLARTERIIRTALQKREAYLENMRMKSEMAEFDDLFVRPLVFLRRPPRPRTKSTPAEIASSRASIRSFWSTASVATPGDDEDTKLLRRSFRKMEAHLCGAGDELDQVMTWLQVVKEVLDSLKQEMYI